MKFSELPDGIRVKLTEEAEEELWEKVDRRGGIKELSESSSFSRTDLYNWKNRDIFLPFSFVRYVSGNRFSEYVEALKGKGRSKPLKKPYFPLRIGSELQTRYRCSATVTERGIPVYQTNHAELFKRFKELLDGLGEEVPYSTYNRSLYEVRIPKYLGDIFEAAKKEDNFTARVEESGEVENGKIFLGGEKVHLDALDDIYRRDLMLHLALQERDSETIESLIEEEVSRIRKELF